MNFIDDEASESNSVVEINGITEWTVAEKHSNENVSIT